MRHRGLRPLLASVFALWAAAVPWPAAHAAPFEPNGIVALLTDYGEADFYVGALKGAVLSACRDARIVDLSHDVPPYEVVLGAWQLWDSAREFPPGTVIVAIVDPGVGTDRRPVAMRTASGHWFLGPDNGLFSVVEREMGPAEYRRIANPSFMRKGTISTSFHGRDIFGPAAGQIACGARFEDAGPIVEDPVRFEITAARPEGNRIAGQVLFVDHYGNVQTNIPGEMVAALVGGDTPALSVTIGGTTERAPLVRAYGDVEKGAMLALIASTGRLEIARNQANAAAGFGARPGSPVAIMPAAGR